LKVLSFLFFGTLIASSAGAGLCEDKGKELGAKVEALMDELRRIGATRTQTVDAYREV
jgi:hypothetical protein